MEYVSIFLVIALLIFMVMPLYATIFVKARLLFIKEELGQIVTSAVEAAGIYLNNRQLGAKVVSLERADLIRRLEEHLPAYATLEDLTIQDKGCLVEISLGLMDPRGKMSRYEYKREVRIHVE